MLQNRVGGEVLGDFAEAGLEAGLAARAADAATWRRRRCRPCDRSRRLRAAAGWRGWPRSGSSPDWRPGGRPDAFAAKLGQAVNGLGQECGLGVRFFVPGGIAFGRAQAKCAAEVDDACAPAPSMAGASSMETSGGVARKTTARPAARTASALQGMGGRAGPPRMREDAPASSRCSRRIGETSG